MTKMIEITVMRIDEKITEITEKRGIVLRGTPISFHVDGIGEIEISPENFLRKMDPKVMVEIKVVEYND